MDGLLVKINYDFLKELENRGLKISNIRVKFLSRDAKSRAILFKSYSDFNSYVNDPSIKSILNDRRYLCSAGPFPVVENLTVDNKNLSFTNRFAWYNITDKRTYVKTITYDINKSNIYEIQVKKYVELMYSLFDTYTKNVNVAIQTRLNSYVDPCYVDAGYVSPNSEPKL